MKLMRDINKNCSSIPPIIFSLVGSRKAPKSVIDMYTSFAQSCANSNVILRSGNAIGFDQTISDIPMEQREVYIPYHTFGPKLNATKNVFIPSRDFDNYPEAVKIVKDLHPNPNLTDIQMLYLARDVYQVLGKDLKTPSTIVFCWTEDGVHKTEDISKETGGTAMAIRVANRWGIPVINLNA